MEPIRSVHNRAVVEAGRLHRVRDRRRLGLTLLEGPHLLEAAIASGVTPRQVFALEDDPSVARGLEPTLVTRQVMSKLAGTATPAGPVAVIDIPPFPAPEPGKDMLVLWEVADPGNAGTIVRSAAAFGLGIAVGPATTDIWSPKALRAGAGAHFRTSLAHVASLHELGMWRTGAAVVSGGVDPEDLGEGPWAVLVGSEPHGLSPEVVAAADVPITIPIEEGVESLNAAAAASIIAYVLGRGSRGTNGLH